MTDPTKSVPWRVEESPHGGWRVLDSTGELVWFVNGGGPGERSLPEAEALARTVAAGSEAESLRAGDELYRRGYEAMGAADISEYLALCATAKEVYELREAIVAAGFGILTAGGKMSLHCVTEAAKKAEQVEADLIADNCELRAALEDCAQLLDMPSDYVLDSDRSRAIREARELLARLPEVPHD